MSSGGRRKALVTGTSTGLGKEIALGFARNGYDVAFADRDASMLDDVMALPELADVNAVPVTLELTSEDSINAGLNAAIEGLGGLDVVVNNAALALIKPVVDVTWDDWDSLVSVNLKGAYFLSARFAAHCMAVDQPGSIVNIASTHGLTGIAGRSVYGITKGGLIQMTRMLAIEWVEQGIRVNTVGPNHGDDRKSPGDAEGPRDTHADAFTYSCGPFSRPVRNCRCGPLSGRRGAGFGNGPGSGCGWWPDSRLDAIRRGRPLDGLDCRCRRGFSAGNR